MYAVHFTYVVYILTSDHCASDKKKQWDDKNMPIVAEDVASHFICSAVNISRTRKMPFIQCHNKLRNKKH